VCVFGLLKVETLA